MSSKHKNPTDRPESRKNDLPSHLPKFFSPIPHTGTWEAGKLEILATQPASQKTEQNTHAKKLVSMQLGIYDRSQHRIAYERNRDNQTVRAKIKATKKIADSQTHGGKKMLMILHNIFEQTNYNPIDRNQIAQALQRPTELSAWDKKLLNRLCDAKLIRCSREPMPKTTDKNGRTIGQGARIVYRMSIDIGWHLSLMKAWHQRRSAS